MRSILKMAKCNSPFCVVNKDKTRGREFEPTEEGIGKLWCPQCVELSIQIQFFSAQTADMIRKTYKEYVETNLPKNVKLILEQFARELIGKVGEEL